MQQLNANSENTRSRMGASYADSMSMGAREDESSTGRCWAAGFHHVMACSRWAGALKLNELFISLIFKFFSGRG
jgi:hypothetical protein